MAWFSGPYGLGEGLNESLKTQIDSAFQKYYPSAANAPSVGYLALNREQRIIRIDPIAQSILGATEACLGESIKMFLPPDVPLSKHKVLVDGAMAAFEKAANSGEASDVVSMGLDAQGKTKVRMARTATGDSIGIRVDIAMLPVGTEKYPIALITRAEEVVELNLTEEKRQVVEDAKLRLAEQASSTFRRELFAWSNAFQVIFGTSRIGKILSVFTPLGILLSLIYGALVVFKIVPPPDFSTHQTIDLRAPSDRDDEPLPSGKPQAAEGHPNKAK